MRGPAGSVGLWLPVVVALLAAASPLAAQCIVENPGGSKTNINRPPDEDVPRAGFSPVARVNNALPSWLCFTAGYRTRLESYSAGNFQPGNSDTYLLTRFRLGMAIHPMTWFRAYTELQDATAFEKTPPLAPPYQSTWDLRRAYFDFGDIEQDPVSLRIGRQDLSFGYHRLVGTAYWRNASRGYDAALVTVNVNWLRVSTFASAPVVCQYNGMSHHQAGNNFYGTYGAIKNRIPNSVLEPYVLWRLTPAYLSGAGHAAHLDEKTVGLHWAGTASRFDYDAESAAQVGTLGAQTIRAWAWSAILGYTFPSPLKPRVFVKYDFASGDRNPTDGVRGTFDQLYPNIHDHHGLADLIAWQNVKSVRAGVRVSVRRNWILASAYNDWWLASATDAFYNSRGVIVAQDPKGLSGTHIGREYDIQTSYRLNRQIEVGGGYGYIVSGEFLLKLNRAHSYGYPYVMVNYNVF